jgi:filamentous hemagglutinin family protein
MRNRATLRRVMLATTALVPFGILAAAANPLGPSVVGGGATVSGTGTSAVTITQTTPRAIINWNSFNIGTGETTRFNQPGPSAIALNRVTGGLGPSQIYGTLTANGRVILVNPDGVMIGSSGVINTAGFLATTNDIANADFMAGRFHFNIPGRPNASIVNEGSITAHSHGFAALVAPGVRNSGTITASYGKIGLASGNSFSLDFYGDKLITLAVNDSIRTTVLDVATGKPLSALVKNDGKLSATGGRVELTAAQARAVVDSVINTSGVIEARSVGRANGKIVLGGSTTKVAGLPQTVKVSGTLDTSNKKGKGGTIRVTGEVIEVKAASFDASGSTGGGRVLIGGDTGGGYGHWAVASIPQAKLEARAVPNATTVSVDADTVINASATSVGNGGKVIVWADGDTTFAGQITARGGANGGDGGFVEVSGKQVLTFDGRVDAGAPKGNNGVLLLDPLNATIASVAGPGIITVSSIVTALQNNDVMVTTGAVGNEPGDLFVNAAINWSTANALWLTAHRHVHINAAITNTFNGNQNEINVLADNTGTGVGTVFFRPNGSITTNGEVNIAFNPSVNPQGSGVNGTSYVSPTENFSPFVAAGQGLRQYMLVNTPADLQNMKNNLDSDPITGGNYVLGRNIDMGNITIQPLGELQGRFSGLGRTISNLTINSGLGGDAGLFSQIEVGAEVSDLNLKNFNVAVTSASGNAGVLGGTNLGIVQDVNVIMSQVTFNGSSNSAIGGLVGRNEGIILRSNASGTVAVGPGTTSIQAGGLVGWNAGSITQSFALGNVTSSSTGTTIELGGLVGRNEGSIQDAYARGDIMGSRSNVIGGLVGINSAGGNLERTYATGTVSGGGTTGGLIGINRSTFGGISESYYTSPPGTGVGLGLASGATFKAPGDLQTEALSSLFPSDPSQWTRTVGHNNGYPHFPYELMPFNTATKLEPHPQAQPQPNLDVLGVLGIEPIIPNSVRAPPTFPYMPDPLSNPPGTLIKLTNLNPTTPPGGGPAGEPPGSRMSHVPGTMPASSAPILPRRAICGVGGQCTSYASLLPVGQFVPNQVVIQIPQATPQQLLESILQGLGLTVLATQPMSLTGNTALNLQLPPGVTMRDVLLRLEQFQVVVIAQANMKYVTVQQVPAAIAPFTASRGDPAQYSMGKLHLNEAHRVASGNNITVAIIDSEIDREHAELSGTITQRFDATDSESRAHSHGTAMAGAIVARDRLLGVAPGARLLAVRAFSETQGSAESTTFTILKGIEWAASQGARVINMSFAGPYDPSLERALKGAAAKGVVLIGASGNAGPKSPPLWPGADPHVIAVTATDSGDKLFRQANRGPYVSVASPGVEILAPAPQASYQMSTGTSIATAHVSGVVALMLERDPTLTPRDIRLILESTASDLGPKGRDTQYGWGLVNPARAISMVEERKRQKGSSPAPAPVQR